MRKDGWKLAVCFIFLITFISVLCVYAQNQKADFPADSLKRIRIIINQSYENCGSGEISLPIEDIVLKFFKYIEVDAVPPGARNYDATIKIIIEGKAEGTYYYPAGYLYTGAYLSGKISFESKKIFICEKNFEVYINTPSLIGVTWNPLRPRDAPFDRALYLPGSIVAKLLEIIYDIYGINPIISTLEDNNIDIQNLVIETLVNIGKPAVEPLITALHDNDLDIKKGSIEALGRLGDIQAVESIIFILQEGDPGIRWKAAKALGRLKDKRAVEPLITMLKDENKLVRQYAAKSLGEIGGTRAIGPLTTITKDNDPGVQSYAKESLENISVKNLNNRVTEIEEKYQYQ